MFNKFAKVNQAGNLIISGNEGRRYALSTYNCFMNFMNALVTGQDYAEHKLGLKNCLENMFVAEDGEQVDADRFVYIMALRVGKFSPSAGQFHCIGIGDFKKMIADPNKFLTAGMDNYEQVEIKETEKKSGKKSAEQKLLESLGVTMEELKQAIAQAKSQAQVA